MGSIWKEIAKTPSILQDIQKWALDNEIDGYGVIKDALVSKSSLQCFKWPNFWKMNIL